MSLVQGAEQIADKVAEDLAHARHDVAEYASDTDLMLASSDDRDQVVIAIAVQMVEEHRADPLQIAYAFAEAVVQLVEERLAARQGQPAEPVTLPPAAADIRLAADFPDNQPLRNDPVAHLPTRRGAVLRFLRHFVTEHGYAPTLSEIADGCGFRSRASARYQVVELARAGLIEWGGTARAIRIVDLDAPIPYMPATGG